MTDYETLMAALAGMPQGMARAWCEELLIRGTPEGGIGGAHVIMGVEMTDPMGGKTRVAKGPYPIDVLAGDFAAVIGSVVVQQQATIAALRAELAARQIALDALADTVEQQARTVAELQSAAPQPEAAE